MDVTSQISLRTLVRFFKSSCCSLNYLHFLGHFSVCLCLLLQASFWYLMPDGLLILIHEAVGSCSQSLSAGQPRASPSARVFRALLCAAGAPHGAAPTLPSSFRFFEEPWFFVFIWKVNPRAFIYFGKEHTGHSISVCPLVSSPPTSSSCLLLNLTFLRMECLWGSAGCVIPCCPPCTVCHEATSAELHQILVLHWSAFDTSKIYLDFFFIPFCVCGFITYNTSLHLSTIILLGF